jgi:hypothetical protein
MKARPRVLAVDIGGTNVKILATGQAEPRKFASGKDLTPRKMVAAGGGKDPKGPSGSVYVAFALP